MGQRFDQTNKKWINKDNKVLWIGDANGRIKYKCIGETLTTTGMYNIMGSIDGCNTSKTWIAGKKQ